jgi:flagellin
MVAISTTNNGVAMAALRRVNADLTTTQNRIATGLRVGSAKDDAGIWATATKIRSDISASESVKSNLSTAKAQVDAATAALDEIGSLVDEVAKITSAVAAGGGTATTSQVNQVVAYTTQITALMGSSAVNGKNLLGAAGATNNLSVATGVSDGALVGTVAYTAGLPTAGTAMTELMAVVDVGTLGSFSVSDAATAQGEIAAIATKLGAVSKGLDSAASFNDRMADVRNNALGGLVDADLERETAKMQALQVRQQLAYQAISMSNNSAQNILMLFR